MDSWLYMASAVASLQPKHDHLLAQDPLPLGWRCQVQGCGFFKPAGEFDGLRLLSAA
ncbi:hypothetical protein O3Q52_19925 [Streptomyces sp. ActVer]|uniref:hypothetical protein n=1 Tax=Streptomyces sp. ActVer TaxID=3014558 RepID=UPI0022B2C40A|nr:hypothetical protein [Streptomyces sp. ActVer]MCZ4510415.1 hypothetical protein [Streptomyces sp. ActVer]